MVRALVLAALAGALAAFPSRAAEPPAKGNPPPAGVKPTQTVERTLSILHGQRVTYDKDLSATPMGEILADLARRHDVTFIVRDELFRQEEQPNLMERRPILTATRIEGLTLHRFLNLILTDMGAAYLVRPDYLEIIPRAAVAKEVGLTDAAAEGRPEFPLVCVAATDKPLADVFGELARAYGLNVVLDPAARRAMKDVTVTEQLLNVPADTALELLAGEAGLSVTRKGNTFRVTGAQ